VVVKIGKIPGCGVAAAGHRWFHPYSKMLAGDHVIHGSNVLPATAVCTHLPKFFSNTFSKLIGISKALLNLESHF